MLPCLLVLAQTPQEARKPSISGTVVVHEAFASKVLGNSRAIRIYLPPNYDKEPKRRYPVFYMHDGQNLFDGMTSFLPNKEWQADEAAEALIGGKALPPFIIVGIDNAGMARGDEYLPTRAKAGDAEFGGKGDLYGKMMLTELMPYVNKAYRTLTGPKNTALGGSSLGGIITLHLGLTHPETFGKLAVVSPSVWWDNRMIVREVDKLPKKLPLRIWLDIGSNEGKGAVADTRALRDALVKKGWSEGKDLVYYEDIGAQHNETAWAKRLPLIDWFLMRD